MWHFIQNVVSKCFIQMEAHNKIFADKLETLLHRAYHLQEDFGGSIPTESVLADFGRTPKKKKEA